MGELWFALCSVLVSGKGQQSRVLETGHVHGSPTGLTFLQVHTTVEKGCKSTSLKGSFITNEYLFHCIIQHHLLKLYSKVLVNVLVFFLVQFI